MQNPNQQRTQITKAIGDLSNGVAQFSGFMIEPTSQTVETLPGRFRGPTDLLKEGLGGRLGAPMPLMDAQPVPTFMKPKPNKLYKP